MKKTLLLLAIAFYHCTMAQSIRHVANDVQRLHERHVAFADYGFFKKTEIQEKKYEKTLSGYTPATLDYALLGTLQAERPAAIRLSLPYNGEVLAIDLYRTEIATADFNIQTDGGHYTGYRQGTYYRGIISGDMHSLAAFSFFDNEVIGVVSSLALGDINIGKLKTPGNTTDYIIYSANNLLAGHSFHCGSNPEIQSSDAPKRIMQQPSVTTKCVRMYYEMTNSGYLAHDSDMTATLNYMTALHNNVMAVYANDGISNIVISEVFVWTVPENYQQGNQSYLSHFSKRRTAFNGDIAGLILGAQGQGGYAWVGLTCQTGHGYYDNFGPYFEAGTDLVYEDFPAYSSTVNTITHEIGHVLGSLHTHHCVWNGNNTQIDDCGNVSPLGPFPEGEACFDPENPILVPILEGTIMSYCPGALAAGFGPQPTQLIINTIENAVCFGTDCQTSCTPSIEKLVISEVGQNSVKLTITDIDPSATEWKFRIIPNDFITIDTNPYIITGLSPKSTYTFEVKQICDSGFGGNFKIDVNAHTSGVYCGEYFYDYGGDGIYGDYSYQTTLHPSNDDERVSVYFNAISTEPDQDILYVHDGPNLESPVIGTYSGVDWSHPELASTHPSGTLTFEFVTDGDMITGGFGWASQITCIPALGVADSGNSGFYVYPNPANDRIFFQGDDDIQSLSLYDVTGRLVAKRAYHSNSGEMDISGHASGCYLIIAESAGAKQAFKMVKE